MYKTFSIKIDQVQQAQFEALKKKYKYRDLQDLVVQIIEEQYSKIR